MKINGRNFLAHRVIWRMVTGDDIPEIDHRNLNGLDNSWQNLRAASHLQNSHNRRLHRGKSLPKGVSRHGNKYQARVTLHGKIRQLGSFSSVADAHAAYVEAARHLHGEFSNPGG